LCASETHDKEAWTATATFEFSSAVLTLSLSSGERVGVRGNRTPAVLAASASDSAPDYLPKRHMALSHSSFQAPVKSVAKFKYL